MRNSIKLILTLLSIFFIAGTLHAQPNTTKKSNSIETLMGDYDAAYLQQLIDTAIKYYPQVRTRAMQTKIAVTSFHQANANWLQNVSIAPSYVYNPKAIAQTNANGSVTSFAPGYQIAFGINLTGFFITPFASRNAKQAIKVAQLAEEEYKYTLTAQVKRLYVAYVLAKANLRVAITALNDAKINANLATTRYQEASTTFTEYNAAIAASYAQITAKLTAEEAVLLAKSNLEEFVGKSLEEIH